MRREAACRLAVLSGVLAWAGTAQAAPVDAESTRRALGLLLTTTDAVIPSGSSCRGVWAPKGRSTVGDVLAIQLASFAKGQTNVFSGGCEAGPPERCSVSLRRSGAGDAVSLRFAFELRRGQVRAASLQCEVLP